MVNFHPSKLRRAILRTDKKAAQWHCCPVAQGHQRSHRRLQHRFRLTRFTSRDGFRNLHEFSGFHVVDVAVNRNVIGNQRMISNTRDILDDALRIVRECQPVDVATFCGPRPLARVMPPTLIQCRCLQAAPLTDCAYRRF